MSFRAGRALRVVGLAAGAGVLLAALVGAWRVCGAWPEHDGEARVQGLSAGARIVRDAHGVPSIHADDEHDLFFAQGYVHAQDRLWSMEMARRAASGRLSEMLGASTLEIDRLVRVLGLRRAAERDWSASGPEERAILEAYVQGVNAFIDAHRWRLPVEFTLLGVEPEPFSPVDTLAFSGLIDLNLGQNFWIELMRARFVAKLGAERASELLPGLSSEAPVILTDATPGKEERDPLQRFLPLLAAPGRAWGSNSWVVHGSRSRGGKPLLANDTHLNLTQPSQWYENALHGGRFDVVGFSMPGMPMVLTGRNARVSWGITNICADTQDVYVEHLDTSTTPARVERAGQWLPVDLREEAIGVRGSAPVQLTVRSTSHGPLLNDALGSLEHSPPLAVRWAALDGNRLLRALMRLNLASDWPSFREALHDWQAPPLNFVYADVAGDIGYQAAGRVPIRSSGHSGLVPASGSAGDAEWLGFLGFDELPSRQNPPEGYIVTANNEVVRGGAHPLAAECVADPFRARRIQQLLSDGRALSTDDLATMQLDTFSIVAAKLTPILTSIPLAVPLEQQALEALAAWDSRVDTESTSATIYQTLYRFLLRRLFEDELGADLLDEYLGAGFAHGRVLTDILETPSSAWFDDVTTPARETRDDILRQSWHDAVQWLETELGHTPADWAWGRVHRVKLGHVPFGQVPFLSRIFDGPQSPARGDSFTVNVGDVSLHEPYQMAFGVSQRLLVDLASAGRALAVNSTAQAGQLWVPGARQAVDDWLAGRYHELAVGAEPAPAPGATVLRLTPP